MAGNDHTSSSHSHRGRTVHFSAGSSVEVKTDEEGFKNVYFSATVVQSPRKYSKKICVQYDSLLANESGSDPLKEQVKVAFLRPVPPSEEIVQPFEPDDVVDAFYKDGWWVGVVSRVVEGTNKFMVSFDDPPDELEFYLDDLRPHWDWVQGKWKRPQSKARNKFDVRRKVEVSFDGEDFQDVWFPATIEQALENGDFMVEYSSSKGEAMEAIVGFLHVRPCPPLIRGKESFILLGKVDAFFDFGWRSGVITKELENNRYLVFFRKINVEKEFDQSELRPLMEWKDGGWLLSSIDVVHESSGTPDQNSSQCSGNRTAHSLLSKRRLYQSEPRPAVKRHLVENVKGVNSPGSVDSMEISVASDAKILKMPKGFRSKRVGRNAKRTLSRMDQEEGPQELPEENPSPGQNPTGNIASEVEENSVVGKMMGVEKVVGEVPTPSPEENTSRNIAFEAEEISAVGKMMEVDNVVGEVPNNQEECPKEATLLAEENHTSVQDEEQNISGKIAVEVEDPVSSSLKEVVKEVCEVPISEIDEESVSKFIEEMDSVYAIDSSRPPSLQQCNTHNSSTVPSEPHILPFKKSSDLWRTIESTDVFKKFPQNPHFQPLEQKNIGLREGLAIGHMVNFSNLLKTTSSLQVGDPKSIMNEILETLPDLETHGFDVSAIRERISELLMKKDSEVKLLDEVNNMKNRILVKCHEKVGLEQEKRTLQEKILVIESAEGKVDEEIALLQAGLEETQRKIKNGRTGLKVML